MDVVSINIGVETLLIPVIPLLVFLVFFLFVGKVDRYAAVSIFFTLWIAIFLTYFSILLIEYLYKVL